MINECVELPKVRGYIHTADEYLIHTEADLARKRRNYADGKVNKGTYVIRGKSVPSSLDTAKSASRNATRVGEYCSVPQAPRLQQNCLVLLDMAQTDFK